VRWRVMFLGLEKPVDDKLRKLHAAVCAAPGDDDVRLVYADRCEELGEDDRARVIRLQVKLAQLEHGDGVYAFLEAHKDACRGGAARLLGEKVPYGGMNPLPQRGWVWAGPALQTMYPCAYKYVRGFVGEVNVPLYDWCEHGPRVVAQQPVEALGVGGAPVRRYEAWAEGGYSCCLLTRQIAAMDRNGGLVTAADEECYRLNAEGPPDERATYRTASGEVGRVVTLAPKPCGLINGNWYFRKEEDLRGVVNRACLKWARQSAKVLAEVAG
jgi:uncharacterized protein (TIGR02996 family)